MGNLLGEPFKQYVSKQIQDRQKIYGKKFERTNEELQYLNSRNAWVKLASGVNIDQNRLIQLVGTNNPIVTGVQPGKQLAMENVLFNGVTSYTEGWNEKKIKEARSKGMRVSAGSLERGPFGVQKHYYETQNKQRNSFLGDRGAYGMGGTDQFGYSPMPGIVNVDVKDLNRGSIKKASLNILCHNRAQFDVIDVLYLRLGYSVLLEWGNDKYLDDVVNGKGIIKNVGNTLTDDLFFLYKKTSYEKILPDIEKYRKKYKGNYDGMFGVISNFSWTFNPDGSYSIKLEIISQGDVVEALKANPPANANNSGNNNANTNTASTYSQQALSNILNEPLQSADDFYNFLYPGLKDIIKKWYDECLSGAIKPQNFGGYFNADYMPTNSFGFGVQYVSVGTNFFENFPFLSYMLRNEYPADAAQYPEIKTQINIDQAFDLDGIMDNALNDALDMLEEEQNKNTTYDIYDYKGKKFSTYPDNVFTGTDDYKTIRKEIAKGKKGKSFPLIVPIIGDTGITFPLFFRKYRLPSIPATSYSATTYFDFLLEASFVKYAKELYDAGKIQLENTATFGGTPGYNDIKNDPWLLDDVELTEPDYYGNNIEVNQAEKVVRLTILQNIGLQRILLAVFKRYQNLDMAGGKDDDQFESQQPEDEGDINEEAELSVEEELENNKRKNKLNTWLYNIRFCWPNACKADPNTVPENFLDSSKGGSGFQTITIPDLAGTPTGEICGVVVNPTGPTVGTLKPIWNESVLFPKYPRDERTDGRQSNAADIIRFNLQPEKQFYVRFGLFLEFVEKHILPKIETNFSDVPLLKIDYNPETNICYTIDNVISLDPNKLIVKNQKYYDGEKYVKIYPEIKDFHNSVTGNDQIKYGNLMNIYFSFERLLELFGEVDEENNLQLFPLLEALCSDINSSLGGINNIEVVIDKETNAITFIDQTSIPGLSEISKYISSFKSYPNNKTLIGVKYLKDFKSFKKSQPIFEVFGYDETKKVNNSVIEGRGSNFVRNLGITTEISKEYASIITIGATAGGALPGAESTAFSKWNIGLQDRFKNKIIDGEANKGESIEKQNKAVVTFYEQMISQPYSRLGWDGTSTEGVFQINPTKISLNKSIAKNFYIYEQVQVGNKTGNIETSVGFIPFNLKLEMDGLSGIKIYNAMKVNTKFLPSNYPNVLSFISTGVNHKISNNEWVTNIETIATVKDMFS